MSENRKILFLLFPSKQITRLTLGQFSAYLFAYTVFYCFLCVFSSHRHSGHQSILIFFRALETDRQTNAVVDDACNHDLVKPTETIDNLEVSWLCFLLIDFC